MAYIDVFNGDADGICALIQLRHANPVESRLVTGVKRDIQLLSKLDATAGDYLTVLDISLDRNRDDLARLLGQGVCVDYTDHHFAGEPMTHSNLKTHINPAADCCTSILVNLRLQGAYQHWAIVGAYGDNLKTVANALSMASKLSEPQREQLEKLGTYINYNGYGSCLEDLHFHPAELYLAMKDYVSPLTFMTEKAAVFDRLEQGYISDMQQAEQMSAIHESEACAVFLLPDEVWARRVSGVFGNALANQSPDRAHAVVTEKANGEYVVSVRAPLNNKTGADDICRQFPSGGGRKAAAGINALPKPSLQTFIDTLDAYHRT